MKKVGQTGLMYSLCGNRLLTYYEHIASDALRSFINERVEKYNKRFVQTDNFAKADTEIIYFCYMDTRERIHRLYEQIKPISGLCIEKYQDIYSDCDLWYMEVFSRQPKLRPFFPEKYGFDIIGFGTIQRPRAIFRMTNAMLSAMQKKR